MKKIILIAIAFITANTIAQESSDTISIKKVKRVSIGAKLGVPNGAGGNFEIVSPLLGNRIAPFFDFSSFKANESNTEVDFSYRELGVNIYFNKKGKGFYGSIGKAKFDANIFFTDTSLETYGITGTGNYNLVLEPLNLKLGIKTGGRIYFRFEVGFGAVEIPSDLVFTASGTSDLGLSVSEEVTEERPEIPGISDSGFLLANISFGISF